MEEKITARLAELRDAERKAELELIVIRNLIAELERLLAPAAPTISGDPLRDE